MSDNIVKFENLDIQIQNLLRSAVMARSFAYCPYSKFQVGASLLGEDDAVYTGCNIENASYSMAICAERTAYVKAISEGKTKFKAIAVVAHQDNYFTTPCGACRQFMSEFGNIDVYIAKPILDDVLVLSVDKLLPYQFQMNPDHTF